MQITGFHPYAADYIGAIPAFLIESDPRPAAEQFNERYAHGGGWRPMEGWTTEPTDRSNPDENRLRTITYPGDEPLSPVAVIEFRNERIWIYQYAWVAIESTEGAVEISRMD